MGGKDVRDAMTPRPRAATPDTPVSEIAAIMQAEDLGAIPLVVDDRPVGIVTDRDIVVRAIAAGKDPRGMTAWDVASAEPVVVHPDDDLSEALQVMARHRVRRLPVVDNNERLVGLLAQADVAFEAKEKAAGEMLRGVSRQDGGPRVYERQ
jgi:CBS domain-containing protein